jgi:Flp pilus assembly protein TadD
MTLGLDYLLWGMNPLGYHLTNLLLHAANAVVFFFVVRRLLTLALPSPSERGRALTVSAAFAALVFAIHPLRVESVAWVTERRDVLSGLFYLSAVLAYLRACDRDERGRGWYWGAVALFAGALLSKSMAVNLPVVLVIVDVYPLRRLGGATGWWSEPARRVYVEKIPFVLLAAAASAIAVMAQFSIHAALPLAQLGVPGRLAVSAYGLSFYLGKMIVPVNLSPLYELPRTVSPWATPFILSFGLAVAITAIVLTLRRRMPGLPAAWLAYLVVLLPVLGIFQSGPQIAADRYTYLAGLGWAILAGAGLLSSWSRLPFLLIGLVVLIPVGLGTLNWNQVHVWHDSKTLWAHALAIDPNSSVAQNDFGQALAQEGKLAEAIEHYRQALNIKPEYADAHYNLGGALAQQGKLADAIDHYQHALQITPGDADAHTNWGGALAQQGKLAEAAEHYQQALRIKPDHAAAHNNWGAALTRQGNLAEAIEHYRQALNIKPDYADAHYNLGGALAQQGKLADAILHYQRALQITPDDADAHTRWGLALAQQGRLAEAIEHYRQALRINPGHADAQSNLLNAIRGLDRRK